MNTYTFIHNVSESAKKKQRNTHIHTQRERLLTKKVRRSEEGSGGQEKRMFRTQERAGEVEDGAENAKQS